jgi:homopolymeric O-antigen transport system ATP-binding protein
MAQDVVIRAEGLGKKYIIGHETERERYTALRDVAARSMRNAWKRAADVACGRALVRGAATEEFWALKDISFEVKRGEVLGIIGRNGAGKSTLLKILSRITEPSQGRVTIEGRVASLLEVGTGFHPELTGRENIFLNGAVLGMSRAEIRRKFDEIVDFSGVEQFLDTPVKRYSSGMYVRLAFAVAAHLEPEILVIDEVLAVGDAEFQKKCLGKIGEIAGGGGRTVLFVSHNLSAITALCKGAMYLNQGSLVQMGSVYDVVTEYSSVSAASNQFQRKTPPNADLSLIGATASYESNNETRGSYARLSLKILARKNIMSSIDIRVKDALSLPVGFGSLGALDTAQMVSLQAGINNIVVFLPAPRLAVGSYSISIDLTLPRVCYYDRVEDCLLLSVEPIGSEIGIVPLKQEFGYGSILIPTSLNEQDINIREPT